MHAVPRLTRLAILGLVALTTSSAWAAGGPTHDGGGEKGGRPISGTVGIRVSVSNVDAQMRTADLDLTMYTRGIGPNYGSNGYAGFPFLGFPALDYGDGGTIPTVTLGLTNSGGGPGGSNAYRSLASFSHAYPAPGASSYNPTAAMFCVGCYHASYVFFPPGSPVPTAFTQTYDLLPTSVIGNFPVFLTFAGTTYAPFLSTSVRYEGTSFPVVTNTALVDLSRPVIEIPTVSEWGLFLLGALLLLCGLFVLRRRSGASLLRGA